ncbi:DUF3168 domain-containing protein [Phyllobacterium endophyticum]|uniref:DUF3168 domain-containing protein n=1 Tax=Phyllobacterium endophyticum TaxID=1149773 RepID=A0A2P7B265_9HYPH|nr:DUF3168 domain-containing protein [Phyllobacterium endophyticum]MBB3238126.1 hypothetical protein [Phyllobacterium endophyticum]PSH60531.1 DUF3168 domain-containing protein [Phyllobacterium endophyticum]TYR42707.1 DUF3168 domain-containing protein [Phyllobacterium endophyticum]
MTSAGLELQKALLALLRGDVALEKLIENRVFDRVPDGTDFPYVTLGNSNIYDWSTATERGSEHLFTLNVWNRASGRKSVFAIMNIIDRLLERSALTLAGHRLVNLGLQYSQGRAEDNRDGYLGILRYRAVTEEITTP